MSRMAAASASMLTATVGTELFAGFLVDDL
jgi:hypothetical protein